MKSNYERLLLPPLVAILSVFSFAQAQPSDTTSGATQSAPIAAPGSEYKVAYRLAQQGKYAEALASLNSMADKTPKPAGLSHAFGMVYYTKGDILKAAEYFKQATVENPNDKEAVQLLGLSYYRAGRPNEAIPYLEQVQSWYPQANVDASYVLGVSYIQAKDYPNARKSFARMFDVPADSAASYLFTARILFRQEFTPVAEDYAQKAIAADPKLPLAHQLLGEIHLFTSKIPDAVKDFEQELAINPANPATYYKLADAYSRVQKYEDAERLLQRSIWLDATSPDRMSCWARCCRKKASRYWPLAIFSERPTWIRTTP